MKKPFIVFVSGIVCVLAIAATRAPFYASGPRLVQAGTTKADTAGKGTNTFTTAYSSVPNVIVSRAMNAFSPSNTTSVTIITTSNFVYDTGEAGTTNQWIAVGTP